MEKAIIYLRVSTLDQETERQRFELESLVKRLGYNLIGIYEEKKSAVESMTTREELTKLRQLSKDDVNVILFWDITRLSRKATDFIQLVNEFSEKGICLYFLDKNIRTLDQNGKIDVMAQLFMYILGTFAQMDAEALKEKLLSGKENALRNGNSYTNIAPFGYYLENKKLHIYESESKYVEYAFKMYLKGTPLQDIADHFNANDIPLKSGKTDIIWVKGTISQLLRNTVYYGKGKRTSKIHGDRFFDCPAIISKELFDQVQIQFTNNRSVVDKSRNRENVLRGLLVCGECGKHYILATNNKNISYRCSDTRANVNKRLGCKNGSVSVGSVDNAVWESIKNIYYTEVFKERTIQEKESISTLQQYNLKKISGLTHLIETHNIELKKLRDAYIKGFVDDSYMDDNLKRINTNISRYEKGVESLKAENYNLQMRIESDLDFSELLQKDLSISDKKHICNELLDKVVIYKVSTVKRIIIVHLKNGYELIILGIFSSSQLYKVITDDSVEYNDPLKVKMRADIDVKDFTVTASNNTFEGDVFGEYSFDEMWNLIQ